MNIKLLKLGEHNSTIAVLFASDIDEITDGDVSSQWQQPVGAKAEKQFVDIGSAR